MARPAKCPDTGAFNLAIAELVGHRLMLTPEAALQVRAIVEGAETFVMYIVFSDEDADVGPGMLENSCCGGLLEVASLVVATRL